MLADGPKIVGDTYEYGMTQLRAMTDGEKSDEQKRRQIASFCSVGHMQY